MDNLWTPVSLFAAIFGPMLIGWLGHQHGLADVRNKERPRRTPDQEDHFSKEKLQILSRWMKRGKND